MHGSKKQHLQLFFCPRLDSEKTERQANRRSSGALSNYVAVFVKNSHMRSVLSMSHGSGSLIVNLTKLLGGGTFGTFWYGTQDFEDLGPDQEISD